MCGRYTLTRRQQVVAERFGVEQLTMNIEPRFNIAPTQPVPVVLTEDGKPRLDVMRWGLVPFWSKDIKSMKPLINARGETIAQKPAFKNCLIRRRCLIPADGFFEWKREGKEKIPMYIYCADMELFAFAGLWEEWKDRESGNVVRSCSIITIGANNTVAPVHDRMPVILRPEDESAWLDTSRTKPEELMQFVIPAADERIKMHEVSAQVNKWSVETPDLIVPVTHVC